MNTILNKTDDELVTICSLSDFSETFGIKQHANSFDDMLSRHCSSRFFKNNVAKAIAKGEAECATLELAHRKRSLNIVREIENQMLTEIGNSFLTSFKTVVRQKNAEVYMRTRNTFNKTLSQIEKDFEAILNEYSESIESAHPLMKLCKMEEAERMTEDFYREKRKVIEDFHRIRDEQISILSGTTAVSR